VVFHRAFTAPGDEDNVLDARSNCLFHAVLDDGFVDKGQHFFGDHLGGGQEARAQAARGKYGLADLIAHAMNSFLRSEFGL
jgi:hypothetical protein